MRLLSWVIALGAIVIAVAASPAVVAETEVFPNGTTNGTASPFVATHALTPRRHEMPWYVTCARFNKVFL
ncbi:hypothetical protein GQ53DRAFT_745423 [Thozetella sp. PMI_491]|nr:hypothetical protein GQ53DRAFT_745423 [Thozetella sp. PMI_491]